LRPADGWDESEALALAAAVEADSEHSIARGIVNSAAERGLALPAGVEGFEAIKGAGVRARYDGQEMYVGGPNLLESLELEMPARLDALPRRRAPRGSRW
jgi:P-type Cu2+ transporter